MQFYTTNTVNRCIIDLTYGGVTVMDVYAQENKYDDSDRVRPPKMGNDERKIGQGKKLTSQF